MLLFFQVNFSLTLSDFYQFPSCSKRKTKQYLFPRAGSRPASSVLNTEETGRKKGKERVGKREEASTSLLQLSGRASGLVTRRSQVQLLLGEFGFFLPSRQCHSLTETTSFSCIHSDHHQISIIAQINTNRYSSPSSMYRMFVT